MPFQEIQDVVDIFLRPLLIGIVTTARKYGKLSLGEAAVECEGLVKVKEDAPVRIEHKGRARYRWQQGPQVKYILAIGPSIFTELIVG